MIRCVYMTRQVTTSDDVLQHFLRGPSAEAEFRAWPQRYPRVVPWVMNHISQVPYQLTPKDLDEVRAATLRRYHHALAKDDNTLIPAGEGKRFPEINNWSNDFCITFFSYHLLEKLGRVPLWPEYQDFYLNDPEGKFLMSDSLRAAAAAAFRRELPRAIRRGETEDQLRESLKYAARWRMGCAYYSFVRELDAIVRLRDRGLDAQGHPLADALFRTDFWAGNDVVAMYVPNEEYRDGKEKGRKQITQAFLGDAEPSFRFRVVRLDRKARPRQVLCMEEREIADLAGEMSA